MNSKYDFTVHTFGCKVNVYDSGLLQKRLSAHGGSYFSPKDLSQTLHPGRPKVHLINSCAVTAAATQEALRSVRRIKARNPFATVIVSGCAAQVDGDLLDALPGVDLVVANSHKPELESILDQYFAGTIKQKVLRSNIFRKADLEEGGGIELGHSRAYLKIQDGCNSFCTYCVIPFARGKSRSSDVSYLVHKIKEFVNQGIAEVVLTGVHIGDYEDDKTRQGLHELIEEILLKTSVQRLRLTSMEPLELTPQILALFKNNERLCPHFHMSIQAAQSRVLKQMRRNYTAEDVEDSLNAIAELVPEAFVGMDVIAGFPGETEDEFLEGFARLQRLPWTRIHAFPYSDRPGTKAERMDDKIALKQKLSRAEALRHLSATRFSSLALQQIGKQKQVLLLPNKTAGIQKGLSRDYWPVWFNEPISMASDSKSQEIFAQVEGFRKDDKTPMEGVLIARWVQSALDRLAHE